MRESVLARKIDVAVVFGIENQMVEFCQNFGKLLEIVHVGRLVETRITTGYKNLASADPVKASEDLQAETKLPAADTIGFLKDTQWKLRDFNAADLESFDQIADFMLMQKITAAKVDFRRSLQVGFYKE